MEAEIRSEDLIAQQAHVHCLLDRDIEPFNRQRVFGPAVYVTFTGAHGVSADRHPFQHPVRVAFEHATVHECARVAFIGVTDDVLLIAWCVFGKFPFQSGRKSCAAAATQPRLFDFVNHLFTGHLGQRLAKRGITAGSNVLFDDFRIDMATVKQNPAHLFLVELHVLKIGNPLM